MAYYQYKSIIMAIRLSVSDRGSSNQYSPIRKLSSLAERVKKRGVRVLELHIGQPNFNTSKSILNGIRRFKTKAISYAPSLGIDSAIMAWQHYYGKLGILFNRSEIVVTTGGSEAILFAFASICSPGEEIIVFEPFYANYKGYASMAGVNLVPIATSMKNGFHLPDRKTIQRRINDKTRGILLCSPNNPTGTVYSRIELDMIAELAAKNNLFVLSDEVYREFVYGKNKHISMATKPEIERNVIILDSISKRFNACGLRIGCLATKNEEVIESVTKYAQARLSAPTIGQTAIVPALKSSLADIKKTVSEYEKRIRVAVDILRRCKNVKFLRPEGGFYMILELPFGDSDAFAEWLLAKYSYNGETVLVSPGGGFYVDNAHGKNKIRLALVLPLPEIKRAMIVLKKGIEEYILSGNVQGKRGRYRSGRAGAD